MRTFIIFTCLILLSACTTGAVEQVKYYDFSIQNEALKFREDSKNKQYLHINMVEIEGAADQQAIVQVLSNNRINIASYHFWSQHPKHTLSKSLQASLYSKLENYMPVPVNKKNIEPGDLVLDIVVNQISGHYKSGSIISGQWFIYKKIETQLKLLDTDIFLNTTSLDESGFGALIKAHEKGWLEVSRSLSEKINQINLVFEGINYLCPALD